MAFQFIEILQTLQVSDFQCSFCDLIFNLPVPADEQSTPARHVLMQTHLAWNCPIVYQLSLLLNPYNVHLHGTGWLRSGTFGEFSSSDTIADTGSGVQESKRRRAGEQALQTRKSDRLEQSRSIRSRKVQLGRPSDLGAASAQPRTELAAGRQTGLLRFVHQQQRPGLLANDSQPGCNLEETSQRCPESAQADAPNLPLPGLDQGASTAGAETQPIPAWREPLGDSDPERHHQSGRLMAISEMASGGEETDRSLATPGDHGQNV